MNRVPIEAGMLLVVLLSPRLWSGRPAAASPEGRGPASASKAVCSASRPNGGHPPGQPPDRWYHGTHGLWAAMWWTGGTVVVPLRDVQPNGRLYVKVGWWRARGSQGRLRITGHRLDRPAVALGADISDGYGSSGFQATALLFPTGGCWQVTGRAGRGQLTMVMRVLKGHR